MAIWWILAALLAGEETGKAPPAMLGFVDAAELSQFCAAAGPLDRDPRLVCLSYVTGAVDQILAQQALGDPAYRTICLPGDVTADAVMREVTAYAGWSREAKGVSAANFVRFAMERAYPCRLAETEPM
jgi:hypothetical protein